MRVGIIALLHESNTFIARPTTLEHFREHLLLTGEAIRGQLASTQHEIGGFFEGLAAEEIDAVPIFAARAVPFGPIEAEAFETLVETMYSELAAVGHLDGVLVAPHGATVSERFPDADGYWLTELRKRVGPQLPIIGTLDPHANLSAAMVNATDALIAYRTNPHLDQRARGVEAARLMAATLRGEVKPTQAAAMPPLAINIERQCTSDPHLRPLYELADRQLNEPGVLSNSILLGFPYADVAEMGSAAIVVTDNDVDRAQVLADQLGHFMWEHRDDYAGKLISIDEALDQAAKREGPVCLLDMGDNVGGGSPGDGTFLAQAIGARRVPDSFVCLYDPESVLQASLAGAGATLVLRLGGKTDDLHGPPLEGEFQIVSLHAGKFSEPETRHGGFTHYDQGATAVVRSENGLTVMLTSKRMPPFSLQQIISCGIDPSRYHILVAKGVNAPIAAYAPVCKHFIRVNTPGCTSADMTSLRFEHRRKPMFPFEWEHN
jgi:microcystin degradation protein MlrC